MKQRTTEHNESMDKTNRQEVARNVVDVKVDHDMRNQFNNLIKRDVLTSDLDELLCTAIELIDLFSKECHLK